MDAAVHRARKGIVVLEDAGAVDDEVGQRHAGDRAGERHDPGVAIVSVVRRPELVELPAHHVGDPIFGNAVRRIQALLDAQIGAQ